MNREKLMKMASAVRTGGKGSVRSRAQGDETTTTDDKRLQSTLKRLGVNTISGIEEVNIFQDEYVIHFVNPKVQASIVANTWVVSGPSQTKKLQDILPSIINQLGPDRVYGREDYFGEDGYGGEGYGREGYGEGYGREGYGREGYGREGYEGYEHHEHHHHYERPEYVQEVEYIQPGVSDLGMGLRDSNYVQGEYGAGYGAGYGGQDAYGQGGYESYGEREKVERLEEELQHKRRRAHEAEAAAAAAVAYAAHEKHERKESEEELERFELEREEHRHKHHFFGL